MQTFAQAASAGADIVDVERTKVVVRVAELAVRALTDTAGHAHAAEAAHLLLAPVKYVLVNIDVGLVIRGLVAAVQVLELAHHGAVDLFDVLVPRARATPRRLN